MLIQKIYIISIVIRNSSPWGTCINIECKGNLKLFNLDSTGKICKKNQTPKESNSKIVYEDFKS